MTQFFYRRAAYSFIPIGLLLLFALTYGSTWAHRCWHVVSRIGVRLEMKVSAWQGVEPRLVSIAGRIIVERPRRDSLKGAQVEALDSKSGWASLTNEHGDFVLRDVTWYPNATYRLVIQANPYQSRQVNINVSAVYPDGALVQLGELNFDNGHPVEAEEMLGRNSISYLDFDYKNISFYRRCFEEVSNGERTDEAKIDAINRYVGAKFDLDKTDPRDEPSRMVLENGSAFCGKLALALATLAESADYRSRLVNVIYEAPHRTAHMVVEIFYHDRWHLYDPTGSSVHQHISYGNHVPSYKELRLDPRLRSFRLPEHLPAMDSVIKGDIYGSGVHHYYYLRKGY